jgi:hypothetical protein
MNLLSNLLGRGIAMQCPYRCLNLAGYLIHDPTATNEKDPALPNLAI